MDTTNQDQKSTTMVNVVSTTNKHVGWTFVNTGITVSQSVGDIVDIFSYY